MSPLSLSKVRRMRAGVYKKQLERKRMGPYHANQHIHAHMEKYTYIPLPKNVVEYEKALTQICVIYICLCM